MTQLLNRYRPWIILGAFGLVVSALLRVLIWALLGRGDLVSFSNLLSALPLGVVNDLIVASYFIFGGTLLNLLLPNRLYAGRANKFFVGLLSFSFIFGILYLAAVQYFFFEEFDARFNLVAVDYLIYPHEVLVNLWDSYPIVWFLIGVLVLTSAVFIKLRRNLFVNAFEPAPLRSRFFALLMHALLIAALAALFSTDSFSIFRNRVANEIAANGVSSFFRALRTEDLNYDAFYRTVDPEKAYSTVRADLSADGSTFVSNDLFDLNRRHQARPDGFGKLNIVVLTQESLGAQFIGALGSTKGLTPHLDALAKQGLFFTRAYATGTRTVRGLEALTASFPPIPSESVVKRPGQEDMATWGQLLARQGYQTAFLYGGFSYFDNMQSFYSTKGFAIQDRFDIKKQTFANIWGVCDEDLYNHAINYFDTLAANSKPFFAMIMSTSNHKPFTFPSGIPGVLPKGGGRDAGVRYADYAIGRFFEEARTKPWYNNTVFVVVADHDARVYGRAQVPLRHYAIPLLIVAPGHIAPREVDIPTSQMDVLPTIAGLLGLEYTAPFYGEDVFALDPAQPRSILVNHNHDVALYRGDKLVVLGLNQAVKTYLYDREADTLNPTADDAKLIDLATSYYQTGFDQFKRKRYRLAD